MKANVDLVNEKRVRGPAATLVGPDAELAGTVAEAIQWLTTISLETIQISVRGGWVTLEGTVDWRHQRDTLGEVIGHLAGVKGVSNLLMIKSDLAERS